MAPQVFTLSEQCALSFFKVNYAIKRCKFTNAWYISMQITGMRLTGLFSSRVNGFSLGF